MADPVELVRANHALAMRFADRAGRGPLRRALEKAQAGLDRRLKHLSPGMKGSFTQAQLEASLRQVRAVLRTLMPEMKGVVVDTAKQAAAVAGEGTMKAFRSAEKNFQGITGKPLALDAAAVLERSVTGTESSVLHRIQADPAHPGRPGVMERYGLKVVERFENVLQQRLVQNIPWTDARDLLIQQSPFLQEAPNYWAERILRTETAAAHNRSSRQAQQEISEQVGGGMVRILCATFDDRTGADSYAVHGQVRRVDQAFDWWEGPYMEPPNRPNDREVVVLWDPVWPVPAYLKPKSQADVMQRWMKEGRKGSPPPKPPQNTSGFRMR
jgi:hypothetical protein